MYSCVDTVKFGIVETDSRGCIISFLEKPLPSATKSRFAVRSVVRCELHIFIVHRVTDYTVAPNMECAQAFVLIDVVHEPEA